LDAIKIFRITGREIDAGRALNLFDANRLANLFEPSGQACIAYGNNLHAAVTELERWYKEKIDLLFHRAVTTTDETLQNNFCWLAEYIEERLCDTTRVIRNFIDTVYMNEDSELRRTLLQINWRSFAGPQEELGPTMLVHAQDALATLCLEVQVAMAQMNNYLEMEALWRTLNLCNHKPKTIFLIMGASHTKKIKALLLNGIWEPSGPEGFTEATQAGPLTAEDLHSILEPYHAYQSTGRDT